MDILEFLNGRKEGVVQSVLEKFKTLEGTSKLPSYNSFYSKYLFYTNQWISRQ